MVPEAPAVKTDEGVVPGSPGWFVINAREARWRRRPGRGYSLPLSGWSDEECETHFAQLGVNLIVLGPGEPMSMYHWEADAEGFFVLSGAPVLVIEGEERPLRQYDYVHCPPTADHVIVGAGDGPSAILAMSSREFMATPEWGGYSIGEAAAKHGATPAQVTTDPELAYARFGDSTSTAYQDGWLP